uniref:Putative LOV domain-containing protein n=1 Tax=Synura petersenii TaxID=52555 RepID=A0A126WXF1_9STRA|nr:putative LOV domain-containing protein [Synura petersenii]
MIPNNMNNLSIQNRGLIPSHMSNYSYPPQIAVSQPKFGPSSALARTADYVNINEIFSEYYYAPEMEQMQAQNNMMQLQQNEIYENQNFFDNPSNEHEFLNCLFNNTDQVQQPMSIQANPNQLMPGLLQSSNNSSTYAVPMRVPPMPRQPIPMRNFSDINNSEDNDYDDADNTDPNKKKRKYRIDGKELTTQQKIERRERNREHAKRSRIRKKVLLDSLQDQLAALRGENTKLRRVVAERIPHLAQSILERCTTEESQLLASDSESDTNNTSSKGNTAPAFMRTGNSSEAHHASDPRKALMVPDFRLISSLITSQQNFVVSDPSLPDNPIVYASEGFCKLTGYKRQEVLGRNCRFLQGPETDQRAVNMIRRGISEGRDVSVCLLNYKSDGTPFWNQFFVAALRGADGNVVNFVGVQCEVNTLPISQLKDRVKKMPLPF